jgi:hypothetical protein
MMLCRSHMCNVLPELGLPTRADKITDDLMRPSLLSTGTIRQLVLIPVPHLAPVAVPVHLVPNESNIADSYISWTKFGFFL